MSANQEIEVSAPRRSSSCRRPVEPMDAGISSIQPGGGVCMRIELAWGRLRRKFIHRFRPGYAAKMRAARRGAAVDYPHEIVDPRDLKFYRNRAGYYWRPEDDPFRWRDRLPVARVGLAEIVILGGLLLAAAVGLLPVSRVAASAAALLAAGVVCFFRDPERTPPSGEGLIVSPADGRVVSIEELEHDPFLGGPAVVVGVFLSVFNVHMNRAPAAVRVVGMTYRKGKFLNALRSESARENEWLELRLEEALPPYRGMRVRQIAGAIARRIVCWAAPGEHLARGDRFGMIKFGSRTELTLPREPGFAVAVRVGEKVRAGTTVLAKYDASAGGERDNATTR